MMQSKSGQKAAFVSMLTASATRLESDSAACSYLLNTRCSICGGCRDLLNVNCKTSRGCVSSHLLNVDCSPLGDVQGYVLLRGGYRDAAAAIQLGCARQDLHIQTTCNPRLLNLPDRCTDIHTYRQTYRRTARQTYRPRQAGVI